MTTAVSLGNGTAPTRRRAVVAPAAPVETQSADESMSTEETGEAETQTESGEAEAQTPAAAAQPRRRGRPPKAAAAAGAAPAAAPKKRGRKPKASTGGAADHKALGAFVIGARAAGVSLDAHANALRAQLAAFDALPATK